MLSVIATLLPHPFQNIAMYYQQPQQQLTFKTLETVSQAYILTVQDDNTIIKLFTI